MQRSGIMVEGVSSKWVREKVFSPYHTFSSLYHYKMISERNEVLNMNEQVLRLILMICICITFLAFEEINFMTIYQEILMKKSSIK